MPNRWERIRDEKGGIVLSEKGRPIWETKPDDEPFEPMVKGNALQFEDAENLTPAMVIRALIEDRKFSYQRNAPTAAIAATLGIAKVAGLIVDKVDQRTQNPVNALTTEQLKSILDSVVNTGITPAAN